MFPASSCALAVVAVGVVAWLHSAGRYDYPSSTKRVFATTHTVSSYFDHKPKRWVIAAIRARTMGAVRQGR
nr:MAG TPA: hypothetical protein [Caudoviricetes sp.]